MSKKIALALDPSAEVPAPRVRALGDPQEIGGLLARHRAYAASAYGYLEPRFFRHTRWHGAEGPGGSALMLRAEGLMGAALYLQGDPEGLEAIWGQVPPPRRAYITYEARHQPLVGRGFFLHGLQPLARMAVAGSTFRPVPSQATPLSPAHLPQANDLYRSDSGALLSRQHLVEGVYYGVWVDGRLASIAGTQLLSPRHQIAMVANVLTHPRYRGRGYAAQCVSALTAALLEQVRDVVLNVDPENGTAVRLYQRLGYREACRLAEGWAVWKGRTPLERALARLYHWLSQ